MQKRILSTILLAILVCVCSAQSDSSHLDYSLPDPLRLENGKIVESISKWEKKRRPEIISLFERYQHGHTPQKRIRTSYEIVEKDVLGMKEASKRTQIRIHFPDYPEVSPIRVLINIPSMAKGAVPALLHISFTPNVVLFNENGIDEGMAWNVRSKTQIPDREARLLKDIDPMHFIKRGYGMVNVYYGDIDPDFDHVGKHGVRSIFKTQTEREPVEWGSMGGWAWGLSRIMDYLETNSSIDANQVAISGVSRLGKAVLWAAVQDERFAMAIPMLSGEGGAAISRRISGETIADLTKPTRYHYWFARNYVRFAEDPSTLPVDAHLLVAAVAPRPILQIVGSADTWSDPEGEWIAAKAATPVYQLYGLKGIEQEDQFISGKRIFNDMGFYMHEGGHTVLPEDFEVMTDFMDLHFTGQVK